MTRKFDRRRILQLGTAGVAGLAAMPVLTAREQPAPRHAAGPVRLSGNENPYGPAPSARLAVSEAAGQYCRYPMAKLNRLRQLIAEHEGLSPDHVIIGSGSQEVLYMAGLAYGLEGGGVLAAQPTFEMLPSFAKRIGAEMERVPLDDSMTHDLDAMYRRSSDATQLIYVCNPNNPTGTALDRDRLRDFCRSVSKHAVVFVDEAYVELYQDPDALSVADMVASDDNVIVARTFSKLHGLAGLRIGYGLARPDIARALRRFQMTIPNVAGLSAAIASFQDTDFQNHSRNKIAEGRSIVHQTCSDLGLDYVDSQTNFVFFRSGQAIGDFRRRLRERGFSVGRPFQPYDKWCRVSIGTTDEMQRFATTLRTLIA